MEERTSAPICERGNDLIAFLYNEVDEREAQDFQRHLENCAVCKLELAAFGEIRDSVIAWRQESLGIVPAGSTPAGNVAASTLSRAVENRKPSAIVAIREFFSLSPMWMKGAMACASVLFCILAGLALASLRREPQAKVVAGDRLYTEQELKTKIEAGVQARLQELMAEQQESQTATVPVKNSTPASGQRTAEESRQSTRYPLKPRRAPLTRSEREQLAADLRLILPKEEAEIDLLGERINR